MQVTAKLNNLRMTPRKVRLVANLVKGMDAKDAKTQLQFMNKKAAGLILKLLNSGLANAKHNSDLEELNLYIAKLVVEAGPSLKRWMPRAMGRATPILKRTCSVILTLEEKIPVKAGIARKKTKKTEKTHKETPEKPAFVEATAGKEETITAFGEEPQKKQRQVTPARPYRASTESKKRFFSRQTFGNIRKVFRRKSI